MIASVNVTELQSVIDLELKYFDSDEQRLAFQAKRVVPRECNQTWQYGPETHVRGVECIPLRGVCNLEHVAQRAAARV